YTATDHYPRYQQYHTHTSPVRYYEHQPCDHYHHHHHHAPCSSPCHPNISTNTSITLPIKRKIKFVYGDDAAANADQENKQDIDPSKQQANNHQPQTSTANDD